MLSRERFQSILSQNRCITLASVYDPMSARIARHVGYECGLIGGSMVSLAVLGSPDLSLISLNDLVEQVTRVTRSSDLPVIVDGDGGYGNALGVMRTISELECAGAAGVSIEDTCLPQPFGAVSECLISLAEGVGKIRAAVAARNDSKMAILARTHALRITDLSDTIARCRAYADAGADGLFLLGASSLAELQAIRHECRLPLFLAQYLRGPAATTDELAACGVKAILRGHDAYWIAAGALQSALSAALGSPADAKVPCQVSPQVLMCELDYQQARNLYASNTI